MQWNTFPSARIKLRPDLLGGKQLVRCLTARAGSDTLALCLSGSWWSWQRRVTWSQDFTHLVWLHSRHELCCSCFSDALAVVHFGALSVPELRIIVRQERDLQSEQLTERLSTGAIVEEIELFGDRLHYSRLSGTGPQTGWVSLRMARKELLIPVKPPARPARPLLGQAPGRPARPEWRHWHSEELPFTQMEPPIRSSSAQSERCERKPTSLPRLPQPKSAPPPRTRPDLTLPPLPPLLPNGKPIHQAM